MTEQEESHCRTCVLIVTVFRLKTALGGSPLAMERSSATGGFQPAEANTIGGLRTGSWSYKAARTTEKQKFFWLMRQGTCDNLINVLTVLTNQQKDGDIPVGIIVTGLLERPQEVHCSGQHEAVKGGDLHRDKKVVQPKFTTDFPGAVILEGADELTLRAHEEGVLRTFIGHLECGTPKMGASAIRRGLARFLPGHFPGSRRTRVGSHVLHYKDLHQAVKSKKSGENKKAKVLWAMKDKIVDYMTRTAKKKIRREPNSD